MKERKRMGIQWVVAALFCAAGLLGLGGVARAQGDQKTSQEVFEGWMSEVSNWGRWGDDDQLGTINLITASKRRQAAALVTEGAAVSLARDLSKETAPDNPIPFGHEVSIFVIDPASGEVSAPSAPKDAKAWASLESVGAVGGSGDRFAMDYHGFAYTHIDALCHIFHGGKMYNGFSQTMVTARGAAKLGITELKAGIITRGVLVDVPRLRGVPYLEPGQPIFSDDLDAWEKHAGVKVEPGDAILIRTGRWARREAAGPLDLSVAGLAGLHPSAAKWLRARDVALLGSDAGGEVIPSPVEGVPFPLHVLAIVAMGMPILDNADLERLSEEAARRGRWEFLLAVAPLRVPGGTGSPVNPLAVF